MLFLTNLFFSPIPFAFRAMEEKVRNTLIFEKEPRLDGREEGHRKSRELP